MAVWKNLETRATDPEGDDCFGISGHDGVLLISCLRTNDLMYGR